MFRIATSLSGNRAIVFQQKIYEQKKKSSATSKLILILRWSSFPICNKSLLRTMTDIATWATSRKARIEVLEVVGITRKLEILNLSKYRHFNPQFLSVKSDWSLILGRFLIFLEWLPVQTNLITKEVFLISLTSFWPHFNVEFG